MIKYKVNQNPYLTRGVVLLKDNSIEFNVDKLSEIEFIHTCECPSVHILPSLPFDYYFPKPSQQDALESLLGRQDIQHPNSFLSGNMNTLRLSASEIDARNMFLSSPKEKVKFTMTDKLKLGLFGFIVLIIAGALFLI